MTQRLLSSLLVACALVGCGVSAGCAGTPAQLGAPSPCDDRPAGYDCQIERYQKAPG